MVPREGLIQIFKLNDENLTANNFISESANKSRYLQYSYNQDLISIWIRDAKIGIK